MHRQTDRLNLVIDVAADLSAKTLLEIAVVLLDLSVSATALLAAGPALIGGIAVIVVTAIAISYGIGRGFGLSHKMAMLVACGNSICGNSVIAAAALVIRANGDDVAASIAFTATLGVLVVLALPLVALALQLAQVQSGIFAGLTIYAAPQVLAAAAPLEVTSVQVGTLVKLVHVLMLGPVLLALSLSAPEGGGGAPEARLPEATAGLYPGLPRHDRGPFDRGLVPAPVLGWAAASASALTATAMAALGLSVDVRVVAKAGFRVTSVVVLSLLVLAAISLFAILVLGAN